MNNYVAVTNSFLIDNTRVGCDLYLQSRVNGRFKYILFCRADELFSSERRNELIERNIKKLFIYIKDFKNYFRYQEKNLRNVIEDKQKSSTEKSQAVYHVAKNLALELVNNPRSGISVGRVTKWVDNTIGYILNDENAFSSLIKVTSHDYYTYTHSVNLSVLGLLFGQHISLNSHDLNCLGTGMLLHDLGKIDIPLEILNKPGCLTKDEFEIIKQHPKTGVKLLEDEKIGEKTLKVIIQHHENDDGTGYPNRIGGDDIHLFGKISRIVDVYDAMTTIRPYADARTPFAALKEMNETMVDCFDKELFKEFIHFLGPVDRRKKHRNDTLLCT